MSTCSVCLVCSSYTTPNAPPSRCSLGPSTIPTPFEKIMPKSDQGMPVPSVCPICSVGLFINSVGLSINFVGLYICSVSLFICSVRLPIPTTIYDGVCQEFAWDQFGWVFLRPVTRHYGRKYNERLYTILNTEQSLYLRPGLYILLTPTHGTFLRVNPFRAAVPIGGRTIQILSSLPSKRDRTPNRQPNNTRVQIGILANFCRNLRKRP